MRANPIGAKAESAAAAKTLKSADDDADLDAYLMGALGSDDEAGGICYKPMLWFLHSDDFLVLFILNIRGYAIVFHKINCNH